MSFNFPNTPAEGATYQGYVFTGGTWMANQPGEGGGGSAVPEAPIDGVQYGRQDAGWTAVASAPGGGTGGTGGAVIAANPPASPVAGMLWWDNNTGRLFIWYDDGTSAQWVQT